MSRLLRTISSMLAVGAVVFPVALPAFADANQNTAAVDISQVNADELLEAGPVDQNPPATAPASATPEFEPLTPETLPSQNPYPIATPAQTPETPLQAGEQPVQTQPTTIRHQIFPYVCSAYIPELDHTEVNLGLLLHDPPGIEAGISWGATREMMLAAKMTVQGASYTAGANVNYALWHEGAADTKPAISVLGSWRFANYRTNNEARNTIFRGNRVLAGVVFSKWLGSLGEALDANQSIQNFMNYFNLHIAALMEYQSGRRYAAEDSFAGFEIGSRTTLEMMIDPELLFLTLTYDSLPDWLGIENYYVGVRYFARKEFAIDIIGGQLGNDLGVTIELDWIF